MAQPMPSGTAISVANPTITPLPMIPLKKPPPASDGLPGGVSVMNPQFSARTPLRAT